jgi:hypothetical protein
MIEQKTGDGAASHAIPGRQAIFQEPIVWKDTWLDDTLRAEKSSFIEFGWAQKPRRGSD